MCFTGIKLQETDQMCYIIKDANNSIESLHHITG